MNERDSFINAWLEHVTSVTQLCQRFGISRNSGHKWIKRFKEEGMAGLADRSRARLSQSHRTPEAVVENRFAGVCNWVLPW
jgi:transposase-like protein